MMVFDALPSSLRTALNHARFDYDPLSVAQSWAQSRWKLDTFVRRFKLQDAARHRDGTTGIHRRPKRRQERVP